MTLFSAGVEYDILILSIVNPLVYCQSTLIFYFRAPQRMVQPSNLKQTPGKLLYWFNLGLKSFTSKVLDIRISTVIISLPVVNWKSTVMITLLNPVLYLASIKAVSQFDDLVWLWLIMCPFIETFSWPLE